MTKSLLKRTVEKISPFTRQFIKKQGEFAAKIDELLESTGMTQRELAEKLGKKESYVSRILAGWDNPTLKTITAFEVALGEDIIDFNLTSIISQKVSALFSGNVSEDSNRKGFSSIVASGSVALNPDVYYGNKAA